MMNEQHWYLYHIQPVRPAMLSVAPNAEEQQIINEHFEYLQKLTKDGTVFLAGRTLNTDPSSFGIILFQAESESVAEQVVQSDPAVKQRVMRAELFPFRIALLGQSPE